MTTVIPMDSISVPKTVSKSHSWELTADTDKPISGSGVEVPVVDLAGPAAVSEIRRACESWGVFQVTNHGVSIQLLEETEEQFRRLFSLPAERKLAAARPQEGGSGYGVPPIAAFFPKPMWTEAFSIFGSPLENARKIWPDHDEHTRFCDVILTYKNEMKQLSDKILGLIIDSLGLSKEDTKWAEPMKNGLLHPEGFLQINSYPICPDPTKAMGLGPHTDSSVITLLHQSADGLQVLGEEESIGWVKVHPVDGALVVFVADLMHVLSNGRFKSTVHRAVLSATLHRLSLAYFVGPPDDVEVGPLAQLIDTDNPQRFRPVTWNHLRWAKSTRFFNVLDPFKVKY